MNSKNMLAGFLLILALVCLQPGSIAPNGHSHLQRQFTHPSDHPRNTHPGWRRQ